MPNIITILDSVKSAISSGSISVKDIEKSIEQISNVKQILPNLINEKENFFKNKSVYLENLKKFDYDSFQSCKNALEKSEKEISSIKSKQDSLIKQIEDNEKIMSDIYHTLEINLKSASSISYKITPE